MGKQPTPAPVDEIERCLHCAGMRASLGEEGRERWHRNGHPGNNGSQFGPQPDIPDVYRQVRR